MRPINVSIPPSVSGAGLHRTTGIVVLGMALCLLPATIRANVIIASSLSTQVQILPGAGSVQFLSPFNASAFVQVFDSLGGTGQQYNSIDDGATSASASTPYASSTAAASALSMKASTTAGVNIPQITAAAGTVSGSPYGLLEGYFEIIGTTAPVSVRFNTLLTDTYSLSVSGAGLSATSEATFNLLLPDISDAPILFYDDPIAIGTSSSLSNSISTTLTDVVTLNPNTPYYLIADTDPGAKGTSMIPEPSCFWLIAMGLASLSFVRGPRLRQASLWGGRLRLPTE